MPKVAVTLTTDEVSDHTENQSDEESGETACSSCDSEK